MSSSWQDDPFAFDDDLLPDAEFDHAADRSLADGSRRQTRVGRAVLLAGAASLALAVIALVMGTRHAGWATVAVGATAYLLAVISDLRLRKDRYSRRLYGRSWATTLLRLVVFWSAVGAAWLAASGLAAT